MGSFKLVKVESQMLIRKPVCEVFEAFVEPEITSKFWFTKSSGRIELGKKIRWEWEMYGVSDELIVVELESNKRIQAKWENDPTVVEWRFEPRSEDATLVRIVNWGFPDDSETSIPMMVDAKGGYTLVLAGLKAWLEHGIELNLIADQFPDGCQG